VAEPSGAAGSGPSNELLLGESWIESLSPWPEEFGLGRMRALLEALGNPQRAFRAVHVVGTNGKSTATRTVEAFLAREGLRVGTYLSPHVTGWSERIRIDGREADFEAAIARVRQQAETVGATQFEALTAAAFALFAEEGVDAAAVEAGLGGRLDATNVLEAPVCLLTNVALEHTEVLGETREVIAGEKLAVVRPGATAVLADLEFARLVPQARVVVGGAREAAAAFVGRPLEGEVEVRLPGRFELRGRRPLEIWDGAHNPAGIEHLLQQLPRRRWVVVASFLGGRDLDAMLGPLARIGEPLVATRSTHPKALAAEEVAERAAAHFGDVAVEPDPHAALERARELAGSDGAVLVTGSLYLLAALSVRPERVPCRGLASA